MPINTAEITLLPLGSRHNPLIPKIHYSAWPDIPKCLDKGSIGYGEPAPAEGVLFIKQNDQIHAIKVVNIADIIRFVNADYYDMCTLKVFRATYDEDHDACSIH